MTAQLACLLMAHVTLACAAVDYTDARPFAWTELLGATYFFGFGTTL